MDGYKRSNAYIATQGEQLLTQTMVLLLSIFIYSPWCNTQLGVTMAWQILCSAGPLPKTFGDFWRMVWEQMVLIIVMTTRWGSFASDFWSQLCDRDAKLVFRYRSGGPRSNLSLNAKKKCNFVCLRVVERGRVKCGQYWPLEEGRTEQHGYFLVRNTHIQVFQDFKLSHLELYNTQVSHTDYVSLIALEVF